MDISSAVVKFLREHFFNPKWKCIVCRKEIFDGKYLCPECEKKLPYNNGAICAHCGRAVIAPEDYCSTCKNRLLSIDMARSCFVYKKPVSTLIRGAKYYKKKYVLEYFGERLWLLYLNNYLMADYFVYVPMTEKAEYKRGYNQSKVLAEYVSRRTNIPVLDCIEKVRETKRQATLNRKDRMTNLKSAFKIKDRKLIKDKTLVLIDDVTTTGSTAEIIAERLKNAGAGKVYLLTVASTSSSDKF